MTELATSAPVGGRVEPTTGDGARIATIEFPAWFATHRQEAVR